MPIVTIFKKGKVVYRISSKIEDSQRFHVSLTEIDRNFWIFVRATVFPDPLLAPLFSKRVQFRKAGHFANSCSRLRAAYEDFIAIFLPIQRLWGRGLECIVLTEVTWRGRITCAPTPMRNLHDLRAKGIGSIKSQTSLFLSSFFHLREREREIDTILNKKNRVE